MEAKDTVMPLEYSALDGLNCAGISDKKILRALNKQAEISFEAGKQEEKVYWAREIERQAHDAYEGGKQEERKEIVEWVEKNAIRDSWGDSLEDIVQDKRLILDYKEWQAFLKSKEIGKTNQRSRE